MTHWSAEARRCFAEDRMHDAEFEAVNEKGAPDAASPADGGSPRPPVVGQVAPAGGAVTYSPTRRESELVAIRRKFHGWVQ